jgi:hypothetical protein
MKTLLIGAGTRRTKIIQPDGSPDWGDLTTLDINPDHGVDVVWDLEQLPLPFGDEQFDEIHAYEVLEHTGQQGDYRFFFTQFADFWRILKPDGLLCASCPAPGSPWVWGDPSHTRAISPQNLIFLNQQTYVDQVGKTAISDFRYIYKANFEVAYQEIKDGTFLFVLAKRPQ